MYIRGGFRPIQFGENPVWSIKWLTGQMELGLENLYVAMSS